MSLSDDTDPESLISRLAGPLLPSVQAAFRQAAEDALARLPCYGEGAAYRAIVELQRVYFTPPPDNRCSGWHARASRLRDGPAIERDDMRSVRYRKLRMVG